jgi:WD40 repeat protein
VTAKGKTTRVSGDFYRYAFCPDGKTLVAQTGRLGLVLVETATGEPLHALAPGSAGEDCTNFAVARRGNLVAVATRGQEVQVLSLPDGARRWAEPLPPSEGNPPELAFTRTGDRLAVARPDGSIAVHDARSGALEHVIPTAALAELPGVVTTIVTSLDFSPDGDFLAAAVVERYPKASTCQVWIIRVEDGVVFRKLGAPSQSVFRVELAPGPLLLVQGYDRVTLHRAPAGVPHEVEG